MKSHYITIKLMYVITSLDYGGTQKQLFYLLKSITQLKLNNFKILPVVVSLKKFGRMKHKFLSAGIPVYSLGMPQKIYPATVLCIPLYFLIFACYIFWFRPQIIHSFLFQANFLSRMIKFFFPFYNCKIFSSERVTEQQKKWHLILSRYTNFLVDKIIVNSNELKMFVINTQQVDPKKIIVIKNMIFPQEMNILKSKSEIRQELGIDENVFLILSVGRLHKQKGYDLLLEVVHRLVKQKVVEKKILFVVVGDGEEYTNLLNTVSLYKLNQYVRFIGYRENVYDYINSCDLFLLTSYWEGSPNVVLEALWFNKPVIVTEVAGVKEILNSKKGCYIVALSQDRNQTVAHLVEKIKDIYIKKEQLKNLQFDISEHLPEKIIPVILSEYLSCLGVKNLNFIY